MVLGKMATAAAGCACATLAASAAPASGRLSASDAVVLWNYQVQPGDTLVGISRELLIEPGRWPALQRLNHVANPRRLRPGSVLHFPAAWVRRTGTPATLVFVQGDVRLTHAASGAASAAATGAQVDPGDLLETAADATATLRFADGSRLLVPAGTRLRLDALEALGRAGRPHTVVDLIQGEADAQVVPVQGAGPSVLTIGTPAVNLGVRGTEFRAHFDAEHREAHAEVTEGVVGAGLASAPSSASATQKPLAAGFGVAVATDNPSLDPVRLLPAPDLATTPARIERVPLRFEWPAVPGATGYRSEVLGDADALLLDARPGTASTKWADLPDGSYRLRVRAVDARGLEGQDADRPFVLKARPEPPLMLEPRNKARSYGTDAKFQWTQAEAPRHYRLQVAAQPDFATLEADRPGLAGAAETVPLAPGTWWWRMAAIADPADAGPFSEPQSFEQRATPEPPALQPPKQDARGLAFSWGAVEPGRHVHYQVATDAKFEHVTVDESTSEPEGVLPKPASGTYYVRARTVDDDDGFEGPWGAAQVVKVPTSLWWLLVPLGVLLWSL